MDQVLKRRAMPCLTVLDCNYCILDADDRLQTYCENAGHLNRLPESLEQMLRSRLREANEAYFVWKTEVLVRAGRLNGLAGECIVVALEPARTRAPLEAAARRFSLSHRETEVLECILCGLNAANIAAQLHIAKRTVGEYFKHLMVKIGAHNRAELISRVLDWQRED